MNRQEPVNGTLILVLGISGLISNLLCGCIGVIPSLVAWSMGDTAIKKLDSLGIFEGNERNNANIGRICGIIGSLMCLGLLLLRYTTMDIK